jgi:diguanylate cyclase (GGDEF)-like protein
MFSFKVRTMLLEVLYGLAGILLCAWAVWHLPATWYVTVVLLGALIAATSQFSIRLNDPARLPAAMPIEMTLLLVAPAPVSILIAALTNLCTSLRYRRPLTRTLFNVANLAVPNGLGALLLVVASDHRALPLTSTGGLTAMVGAVAVRMLGNMVGQAALWWAEGRDRFWHHLSSDVTEEWRTGGYGLRILPVLMALAYAAVGWWVLVLGALLQISIGASMRRYQERVDRQTLTDGLTGLGNRKAWELYRQSETGMRPHLLAMVDLDGLKQMNDTLGHDQGDALIMAAARSLCSAFPDARVLRMGGDEFLVAFPIPYQLDMVQTTMEKIANSVGETPDAPLNGVSASFGLACVPEEAPDLMSALSLADKRMYVMKSARKA